MSNAFCVKPSPLIHCGYESNFMIFDRLIRLTFSLLNNSNSTVSLHLCLFVLLSENHCASLFISCGITHCSLYLSIVSASGIPPKVTWPAAMAASARVHLQRWRSPSWHRVTAAIHGRSLEIRATKPLITL